MSRTKAKTKASPTEAKPLTMRQIEILTDGILDNSSHDARVTTPLILLMDELATHPDQAETLGNTVMRRCYAGSIDADKKERIFIEENRKLWSKALGEA